MTRAYALLLALLLAAAPLAPAAAESSGTPDETRWLAFLVAGESALAKEDFPEAEKLFRAALRETSAFAATDERRGVTLNLLATALNAQRRYREAETLLRQARAIWEKAPPDNELHLATTLHQQAGILHARGDREAAVTLLKRALAIRERDLPPEHRALRHTRESLAALGQPVAEAPARKTPAPKAPVKPKVAAAKSVKAARDPARAAAPAATGRFALHLASLKTVAGANKAWNALKSKHGPVLGELGLILQAADLGSRGTFQRVLAGPVAGKADARDLCRRLKAAGQYCTVVANPGAG